MKQRLHPARLVACVMVLAASCFLLTSSQTVWIKTSSPLRLNLGSGGWGINLGFGSSGSLRGDDEAFVIALAIFMAVAVLLALLPYLRVMALAVIAAGALAMLIGFGALSEIKDSSGSGILDQLRDEVVQRSPGIGVYLMVIGGSLGLLGGVLTLLTPRRTTAGETLPAQPRQYVDARP